MNLQRKNITLLVKLFFNLAFLGTFILSIFGPGQALANCSNDSDCNSSGNAQICDLEPSSSTYLRCIARPVFIAPPNTPLVLTNSCDPAASKCQAGLICDPTAKQCLFPVGASCTVSNSSCQTGSNCDALKKICVLNGEANPVAPAPITSNPFQGICDPGNCPTGLCKVNGLCLPPNDYKTGIASATSLTDLITKIVQAMLAFAGVIAVVFIIIGGYQYMASGGNEEMAEKGKKTISNFVIGLVIIILAFTIVTILSATLTGADKLLQK